MVTGLPLAGEWGSVAGWLRSQDVYSPTWLSSLSIFERSKGKCLQSSQSGAMQGRERAWLWKLKTFRSRLEFQLCILG